MNMKMTVLKYAPIILTACLNMPTPTSQITDSYTSGLEYDTFDCSQLPVHL